MNTLKAVLAIGGLIFAMGLADAHSSKPAIQRDQNKAEFQRECVEGGGFVPAGQDDECRPNPVVKFSKDADEIDYRWPTYRHFEADCKAQGATPVMFEDGSAVCTNSYHEGDDIKLGA